MDAPTSDRNLLFGILALQLDFIDRDQLVAAMNAWVLDKASPLGRILMDQGALSPTNRALLEPLVDAHLQRPGGDPQASLASLGGASSVRSALAEVITDDDVQASLAAVETDPSTWSTDDEATSSRSAGTPTSEGARFRVLRPHARGGLGAVFVAMDEELNREVALNHMHEAHADEPASRHRFLTCA